MEMKMRHKSILTALIVLMLTGSVNAVPVVSFVDEYQTITTTPGSVVHLEIQTNETMIALEARIDVYGDAIISGAINISDCASYGWDPGFSFDPLGLGTNSVEIAIGNFSGNSGPLVAYVDITYGSGQVIVSGYPKWIPVPTPEPPNYFSDGDVTIIPEPATILLLALGALTLRRKSRL
jgi:hypothetical protein